MCKTVPRLLYDKDRMRSDGRVDCNQLAGWRVQWNGYTLIVPVSIVSTVRGLETKQQQHRQAPKERRTKRECSEIANRKANQ